MFHPDEAAAASANPSLSHLRPAGAASPSKAATSQLVGSISSDMSELQRRLDSLAGATGRGVATAASQRFSSSLYAATSRS